MKAIVFTGNNEVQLVQWPDPEPIGNDVVIEVKASSICHTDYEVLNNNYGTGAFPVVPGHEYAGIVVGVGADVVNVAMGDRVVVDPNVACADCRACRRGWSHLCGDLDAYGVTTHGGFAELSLVDAANVHPVGDMSFSRAALAEPMGCVLNGVDAVFEPWMEEVLIFGAGPMGLLMGMALKSHGVSRLAFCDIRESRLEWAAQFGFETVESGSAGLETWHHNADLVVEATGIPQVAARLTHYMANGGKGLFFGVCPSDTRIEMAPFEMFRRQLTLAGSHSLNHNIPKALGIIAGLEDQVDRVVSHHSSLEEIAAYLGSAPPNGSLKVQWSGE